MISPNFINEVFNAKVWWDAGSRILAVTSGTRKSDGILRVVGDKLFMNGEPYYEISFNKFDLFYQLWASSVYDSSYPTEEYQAAAAEAALSQLKDCGFNSIRVFCSADIPDLMYDAVVMGKYFETMDQMFDLCDKYGIKAVVCLNLISDNFVVKENVQGYGLVDKEESVLDLVAYPDSESRAQVVASLNRLCVLAAVPLFAVLLWRGEDEWYGVLGVSAILVLAAVILLVTKRRMSAND